MTHAVFLLDAVWLSESDGVWHRRCLCQVLIVPDASDTGAFCIRYCIAQLLSVCMTHVTYSKSPAPSLLRYSMTQVLSVLHTVWQRCCLCQIQYDICAFRVRCYMTQMLAVLDTVWHRWCVLDTVCLCCGVRYNMTQVLSVSDTIWHRCCLCQMLYDTGAFCVRCCMTQVCQALDKAI